ncbi:MAG: PBP1A family penicillin-binding protein, partial [Parvularculaceae bacterium]|nr:PBP1A family penicillin-binding protein [Parvularculaceae bacterium]
KSGGVREGGSTITQQLARNLFLTPEQSYTRKAKEALLALWLEGRYSKDEILSLYLNRIYLGAGAYGIESAAKTYFGKSARDVSLGEAAMLAGLPKAPSTLAPTLNPDGAQDRAFDVIDNLQETGEITAFEAREARKTPPVVTGGGEDEDFGYFFDYVSAKARDIAGPDAIDLVITTTIDQKLQRDAEAAVKQVLNVDAKLAGAGQAALIAYDTGGAVRAMVGGRSYVESQFNRATQAKRQSGSAFKPFVYAAAFENGLEPKTRFTDQPIDVDGWRPTNYGDTYAGPMRLTEAMAKSVNSVAVQVSERIGRRKVVEMAHRLGVKSDLPAVPSIALGAANVSLDELTAAYLPFARHGMSAEPYAILKIGDGLGGVIYQHTDQTPEQLISDEVARDITHVLYQVVSNGTGKRASMGARAVVGKTGTTNDWRDAWFIGYSAQLVAGVWVGNDDNQAMNQITGGSTPAQIWKEFMTAAHQDLPKRPLDGAFPAATYADEGLLLNYYSDVSAGFARVRRDGDERRGGWRN